MKPGLGTQLRHLIELLDGAVQAAYVEAGLAYRPRFTPIMRALIEEEPRTIGDIAVAAGITQPAATQTVGLMLEAGLVEVTAGTRDGRQRLISLSSEGHRMVAPLQQCWQATARAAATLDADLPFSLSELLSLATQALQRKPFGQRLAEAHATLAAKRTPSTARQRKTSVEVNSGKQTIRKKKATKR